MNQLAQNMNIVYSTEVKIPFYFAFEYLNTTEQMFAEEQILVERRKCLAFFLAKWKFLINQFLSVFEQMFIFRNSFTITTNNELKRKPTNSLQWEIAVCIFWVARKLM